MYSGTDGTGTLNPALLSSSAVATASSAIPHEDTTPRGTKRSRSPADTYTDFPGDGEGDDGDSKPRKRGRPMKPLRGSGGVPESPTQSSMPQTIPGVPPQTPKAQTTGLPAPVNTNVTPTQGSPPKSTPTKSVKALPTVRDHTTDQLGPDGDEYVPREYDEAGEKKVTATGQLTENREYRCRTFFVPARGDKLFMLATECARVLGYRDSYLLFNKNRSLYKIIATQTEKEDLIHQEILPFSYRSRQIAIVTAKSMFRQFGSRVIVNGRRVRDDYWESKAIKQGFTEDDLAGEKRPGGAKARDAAAAEASANASMLGHHGEIVYSNTPVHFGNHPQAQAVQPATMGPGGVIPLPMITLPSDQNDLRLGDYRNSSRPRQEITGPAYSDRTQTSAPTELLTQAHHAAEYNKQVNQQRNMRNKFIETIWRAPHETPPPSLTAPNTSGGEHIAPISQPLQSPHPSISNMQQTMLSNQGAQQHMMGAANYTQAPHQSNPLAQAAMRGMPQGAIRQDQMHGRSPSLSLASTGMSQNNNPSPYGFPPQSMWTPTQPQQSPQHPYSGYNTHGPQPSPHLQQSPHQAPPQLRHSTSNPQMQTGMQYSGMPGIGYPTQNRGMYQADPASQQYMQSNQAPQQSPQGWAPQQPHPQGQGNWGWNTQG